MRVPDPPQGQGTQQRLPQQCLSGLPPAAVLPGQAQPWQPGHVQPLELPAEHWQPQAESP